MMMNSIKYHQTGVGMIEVLIALFVLAIGMLGVAALQATALRNTQSSMERSQATMLTYNLFDAMRADLDNARNGAYQIGGGGPLCSYSGTGTLAAQQLTDWFSVLQDPQSGLGSTACAMINNCSVQACTVTIQWNDERGLGGTNAQRVVTVSRL